MWAGVVRRLASAKTKRAVAKRPQISRRYCVQSTAPSSDQQSYSKRFRFKVPLVAVATTIALAGGAVAYYKWKKGTDVVPYSPALAKTCLLTLKQGGSATAIYWASNILSHMAASSDLRVAEALINDGILEATVSALSAHFDPAVERHIQGRSVYHFLCILESLCAFPSIANTILTNQHGPIVPLIIKTGYEINSEGDTWVDRLGSIFSSLIQASSALSDHHMPTFLESPEACFILSNRLLPHCSKSTGLLETSLTSLEHLCNFNMESALEMEAKFRQFETLEKHHSESSQSDPREGEKTLELESKFWCRVLDIGLALSQRAASSQDLMLSGERITSSLSHLALLMAYQEAKLLSRLESRIAVLQAERSFYEDEITAPLLYQLDPTPWWCQPANITILETSKDPETRNLVHARSTLKAKCLAIIDALTSTFTGTRSLSTASTPPNVETSPMKVPTTVGLPPSRTHSTSELLKALVAITSSKDADVMFLVSKKTALMNELLSTLLVVETQASPSSASSIEYEEWETCPMADMSPIFGSREAAMAIRKDCLDLLSNMSFLPSVANRISIARCLCSVQLQLSEEHALQPIRSLVEEAQQTIDHLTPISQILTNVSKYAPSHISTADLERLIAMNPSELLSLEQLASITTGSTAVSSRILQSHTLYHFITASLSSLSTKLAKSSVPEAATGSVKPKSGSKPQSSSNTLPLEDNFEYAKLRLSMQVIANLAEADPSLVQSKIASSNLLPVLLEALSSSDAPLKSLVILTFARLASSPDSRSSRHSIMAPESITNGVSILAPSTVPVNPTLAPTDPTEIISNADFDIVFIHGINGHAITTWRVEPNQSKKNRDIQQAVVVAVPANPASLTSSQSIERSITPLVSNTGSKAADGKKEVFPICWPRDWLPSFVPHARILTVAYDIALTKWSSNETAPLKQQAANVLQKLRLMGVGEKPTIFICHSFGGLIAKEMLHMSHKRPEFEAVLKNTKAIIFFSTPHVGSMLAGYANGPTDLVFRGSPAVIELFPTNWYLHHLNAIFPKIAPQIHTLSIGEIETCFLDGSIIEKYACYHIVPDESANPYWPGDQHRFIKLQYNHRQVCKPENQSDERFQLVIDFLRRHAPKL